MPQEPTLDVVANMTGDPQVITRKIRKMHREGRPPSVIARYLATVGVNVSDDVVRRWFWKQEN